MHGRHGLKGPGKYWRRERRGGKGREGEMRGRERRGGKRMEGREGGERGTRMVEGVCGRRGGHENVSTEVFTVTGGGIMGVTPPPNTHPSGAPPNFIKRGGGNVACVQLPGCPFPKSCIRR